MSSPSVANLETKTETMNTNSKQRLPYYRPGRGIGRAIAMAYANLRRLRRTHANGD